MLRWDRRVLDACDVGHRVVVRHRLGADGRATDVLGDLVAADAGAVVVRAADGREHRIERSAVVAARRVPPRPPRYSEMLDLERVADRCWPAPVHERLGQWYLRAADGWTGRANSALPLGDAGLSLPAAIDAVIAWYADRGLPPRVNVPLPVRRDVADELRNRGWTARPEVLVQTATLPDPGLGPAPDPSPAPDQGPAALRDHSPAPDPSPAALRDPGPEAAPDASPRPDVRLRPEPSDAFLAMMVGHKGALPPIARSILDGPATVAFAEIPGDDNDAPLQAIARGVVVDGWLHLGLVQAAPTARRRGYGRAVTRALSGWARGHGATRAVLQVEATNTGAVALYAGLGFTTHHTYVTYEAPPAD